MIYNQNISQKLSNSIKHFLLQKYYHYIKKADKIYYDDVERGFRKYLNAFNLLKLFKSEWMFLEANKHCKKGKKIKRYKYIT